MRKIDSNKRRHLAETPKTEFTKEEILDILDFYLQYKPLFDEASTRYVDYLPLILAAQDFTALLYEYDIADTNYFNNMDTINRKYGKKYICDLSKENLDFFEIITVFTFIHRAEHMGYGSCEEFIKDNTYYNLLCRLEEIKTNYKTLKNRRCR